MSTKSKIEYVDTSWNPITGCTKCSPGCQNCYAEKFSARLAAMGHNKYQMVINSEKQWNNDVYFSEKDLKQPVKWKKPRRIFVNSMSDTFHSNVWWGWICDILDVCWINDQHEYLFLTKRIDNAINFLSFKKKVFKKEMFENIWLGISLCTQNEADRDIPKLLKVKSKVKFLSVEPMLEQIIIPEDKLKQLDWVIIGCESGPGAREIDNKWITNLILDCMNFDIPVFLKQMRVNGKLIKNPNIGGKNWNQFPEVS